MRKKSLRIGGDASSNMIFLRVLSRPEIGLRKPSMRFWRHGWRPFGWKAEQRGKMPTWFLSHFLFMELVGYYCDVLKHNRERKKRFFARLKIENGKCEASESHIPELLWLAIFVFACANPDISMLFTCESYVKCPRHYAYYIIVMPAIIVALHTARESEPWQ